MNAIDRDPFPFKNKDTIEYFSKATKYTFETFDRANRFRWYMADCPTRTLWLQEDNVIYAVHQYLQTKEWKEARSINGLDLGKLESLYVYDDDGEHKASKRWDEEGNLIHDYLRGEYNRHNDGKPIAP